MAECQLIAFHGWGFSSKYWQNWNNHLSEYGVFQSYDRGYFNNPRDVELASDKATVIISHSFGLHFIDESYFAQADLLIINSGFLHFHPYAAQYKRRSKLVMQEMINNLEVKPKEVLEKYYQNCYAPQHAPEKDFGTVNHQLLLDDLRKLQTAQISIQLLKKVGKICILHGFDDHIVPKKKGREIYTQLSGKSKYFEIKEAGHTLPYTHHKQCLNFIAPEIEEFSKVNV